MLVMNSKMNEMYRALHFCGKSLSEDLARFAKSEFIEKENCLFLRDCLNVNTNVKLGDFPDRTGYECFINSINIDDFVSSDFLEYGVLLARAVLGSFKNKYKSGSLNCIMAMGKYGLKVKFHIVRPGEQWLSGDLNSFDESIMIIDSDETDWI